MRMRYWPALLGLAYSVACGQVCGVAADVADAAPAPDAILAVLEPEIDRNLAGLRLPDQPVPYYLAFSHVALDRLEVIARLGDIVLDDRGRQTYLHARMRVGSTVMDNANFAGYTGWNGTVQITTQEGANPPLRRDAWLAADAAYKRAVEAYAAKDGALKRNRQKDRPQEFSPHAPHVELADETRISGIERARAREAARQLASALREFPQIQRGEIRVLLRADTARLFDSDGFVCRQPLRMAQVLMTLEGQTGEGMRLREIYSEMTPTFSELPALSSLLEGVRKTAGRLVERIDAPDLPGPY
jgi:TldD protein